MRVLLYADDCNPEMASEPSVAFNTARSIVEHVDEAVVVTQVRNLEAIEKRGMGKAEVVYLDTEYVARPVWKLSSALRLGTASRAASKYPVQYAFERELWKRFGSDLGAGRFDIVHRIGPISSALPSPLASWSKTPFVIGPVNGGLPYPPGFSDVLRSEGEWLRYVRQGYRLLPYANATYRKAAAILAAFPHTIEKLPPGLGARIIDFPEVGADPGRFTPQPRDPSRSRVDILFVGRLVPFKCADVVISAFAASEILKAHRLLIVGDGPERPKLEALIRAHGLGDCCAVAWLEAAGRGRPDDGFGRHLRLPFDPRRRCRRCRRGDAGGPCQRRRRLRTRSSPDRRRQRDSRAAWHARGPHTRIPGGVGGPRCEPCTDALPWVWRPMTGLATRLSWDARARRIVEIYRWVLGERPDKPLGPLEG